MKRGRFPMDDIIFSSSFLFRIYIFQEYHYTDNRAGSPSHYFAYMLKGSCKIVTDTGTVKIKEGDFFYIPNKCSYQSFWYGDPEIKFISLGFRYLPNIDHRKYPVQVVPHYDEAESLFFQLSNAFFVSAGDIGVFYTLVGLLLPRMVHSAVCRSREIVDQTKDYLVKNPYAKTAELARNCAISEAALYAAFQKSSDMTLNQLRNTILLEKAKDVLITTDQSIEYVSDLMQFSSPSYFRKKFSQHFHMTPSKMRKQYRI